MLYIHTKFEVLDWFWVLLKFRSDENPVLKFQKYFFVLVNLNNTAEQTEIKCEQYDSSAFLLLLRGYFIINYSHKLHQFQEN